MAHLYGSLHSFIALSIRFRSSYLLLSYLLLSLSSLSWGQCFTPAINVNANNNHVIVGDFNGDGKPDFAATQSHYNQNNYTYSDSITIFLNQGGGLFDKGITSYSGGFGDSLAVGDINVDGKLDVAIANGNESVGILLGDGKGRLAAPSTLTICGYGYPAMRPLISDFNADGYPDLAVAGLYDSVTVFLNNGRAGFGKGVKYSAGKSSQINQTKTGDFNRDDKPDLILVQDYYHDYFVSLLLNNGAGGFALAIIIRDKIFKNANATEVGDFNGDGKPDLVVVGDSIAILLNNANGGFAINRMANPNRSTYYNPTQVAVSDFNGDGKADLVLPGYVLLGKGNGFFDSPVRFKFTVDDSYGGFLTGDFDANGRPDLLAAMPIFYTGEGGKVSIFLNCTLPINAGPKPTANDSQTATVGVPFSYTANTFTTTGMPNSLTYSASLSPANGLSFDPATRLISGTPSLSGVTTVTITATDPSGLSAVTSFTITAKPPIILGVDELGAGQLTLSPNPATDLVQVRLTNAYRGAVSVQLLSAGGQTVRTHASVKTADTWQHTLSVQGLPAGSYYLSLQQNGQQAVGRLLKR